MNPRFAFQMRDSTVSATFIGNDPFEMPNEVANKWTKKVHALSVTIDEGENNAITRVVGGDAESIIGAVIKPANRVIRSLRNFGLVTHVSELRPEDHNSEIWLDVFSFETSTDGKEWKRLGKPADDLAEIMTRRFMFRREYVGQFETSRLQSVKEAVEDNLSPGPEYIFLANALESLRQGDLRIAVVESVICIEILIAQLFPQLMSEKGARGDDLPIEITLHHRIKVLLPLLLKKETEGIDIEAVLRTIKLRNGIAHKTGFIPSGIPDAEIRGGIAEVLSLAQTLAHKRDSMAKAPGLRAAAQQTAAQFEVREPFIEWLIAHSYRVTIPFIFKDLPPRDGLIAIAEAVVGKLREIDHRVTPNDVMILFTQFQKPGALWHDGTLTVPEQQPPAAQ